MSGSQHYVCHSDDGEKALTADSVESGHARQAVSRDDREWRKCGQNVAAELGAGNREKYKYNDEPDTEEARGYARLAARGAVVGAHGIPSDRNEKNPRPRSAKHNRDEEPRAHPCSLDAT